MSTSRTPLPQTRDHSLCSQPVQNPGGPVLEPTPRSAPTLPLRTQNPPLTLQIVHGELTDTAKLAAAVAQSAVIVSLLGPQVLRTPDPDVYAATYAALFPLMRAQARPPRILAMSTVSVVDGGLDGWSLARALLVLLVRLVPGAYRAVTGIAAAFVERADGLEWTVFRIGGIPGGADEASWRADREDGEAYAGGVGKKGWMLAQKRGALARWLVDQVENGQEGWVGKMPAVSKLSASKWKIL